MRVARITYARLRNLGNFENERVELEAELDTYESPEDVGMELRALAVAILWPARLPSEEEDGAV